MYYDFEKESKMPSLRKILKEVIIFIVEIIVVIALAYFVVNYTVERTTVIGDSMSPTLKEMDKVIINKMAYRFGEPKRFDVIVFKQSNNEHEFYNIKRVIGLPGETIQISNGKIFINGDVIKEPFITEKMNISGLAAEEIKLQENEYFVLGDNRNHSEDSRFANVGNIVSDEIIGKVWIRMNNFNFVNKINLKKEAETETEAE